MKRVGYLSPERFSLREAGYLGKNGIHKHRDILRAIRQRRLAIMARRHVLNGWQAGFALCIDQHKVGELIDADRLPAQIVEEGGDRWHYEILFDDVEALAEELDGA